MLSRILRSLIVSAVVIVGSATPCYPQPIDQVPMYGGADRSAVPSLKEADDTFIEGVTRQFGSRAAASAAFANQGFAYYRRDDLQNAMRRFNQAWLLNPDNADAYWGFASVLSDRQRYCEATTHMETALSKGGIQPGALPDGGIVLVGCAMTDAASDAARKVSLLTKAEDLFEQAMTAGAPKDYTLVMWARAKFAQADFAGAWAKVKEMREVTGKSPPPAFLRALEAKMAEPR
jgi:tetratricopeptide (TPR) repeat protein